MKPKLKPTRVHAVIRYAQLFNNRIDE